MQQLENAVNPLSSPSTSLERTPPHKSGLMFCLALIFQSLETSTGMARKTRHLLNQGSEAMPGTGLEPNPTVQSRTALANRDSALQGEEGNACCCRFKVWVYHHYWGNNTQPLHKLQGRTSKPIKRQPQVEHTGASTAEAKAVCKRFQ